MCGRFTLRTPANDWCQMFFPDMEPAPADPPRYNIAPTQGINSLLRFAAGDTPVLKKIRWGLVPSWADDLKIGNRMINARAETVDAKPSFKRAFTQRRCLVIADGYYEWKKTEGGKQPFLIEQTDQAPMAFAGLWDQNNKVATDGASLLTCTIITTSANTTTRMVHDRMPVILSPENYGQWIDPNFREVGQLKSLLTSCADDRLKLTAVSQHVNSPRNDDVRCVDPI